MRTIPFKEVLWSIAYKLGLDPAEEFLTDEGESLCSYINAWVRRGWDSADWPEWTSVKEFTPNVNHQIPYNAFPVDSPLPVVLSRPLKVYLVDPKLTPYPIDARFREWDQGLHVGFDHGATVWIKYIGPAPRFTSIPWSSATTYGKDDLAYSPVSGECYKSLVNGNIGNDPPGFEGPVDLTVDVLVPFAPGSPAVPVTLPEKWSVQVNLFNLYSLAAVAYSVTFLDFLGALHTFSYTTPGAGGTVDNLLNGLIAAAAASGDTWLTALALSKDTPNGLLIAQLATAPFQVSAATATVAYDVVTVGPVEPSDMVTGDDTNIVIPGP